jgi:hypothetical protein
MREEYTTPELIGYPPLTDVTGGSFDDTAPSDRNIKTDIHPVDPTDVLDRVASMPVSSWVYKKEPNIRHIGPMAQDFRAAFGVGKDDKTIYTVDAQGVTMAAIQGLYDLLHQKDEQIAALESRLAELENKAQNDD